MRLAPVWSEGRAKCHEQRYLIQSWHDGHGHGHGHVWESTVLHGRTAACHVYGELDSTLGWPVLAVLAVLAAKAAH